MFWKRKKLLNILNYFLCVPDKNLVLFMRYTLYCDMYTYLIRSQLEVFSSSVSAAVCRVIPFFVFVYNQVPYYFFSPFFMFIYNRLSFPFLRYFLSLCLSLIHFLRFFLSLYWATKDFLSFCFLSLCLAAINFLSFLVFFLS